MIKKLILFFLCLVPLTVQAQEVFDISRCLRYAIDNNQTLQKDRLSLKSAALSKKEIVGAWLPQLSASGNFTYNIQKTTVAMPNFMNSMMPESMRDPNASKYMKVEMGMDFAPNFGASLAQQVVNFSLLNAVKIAETAQQMAETGLTLSMTDVVLQTSTLYYSIQVLEYAISRFDEVISLMDRTIGIMKANKDEGLVRDVDLKRITVARTNLQSESGSIASALDVQKRLLKLQMGFPMEEELTVSPINEAEIVRMVYANDDRMFDLSLLPAYRMLKNQQNMLGLQYKTAVSANLPTIVLIGNASMNYMWDVNSPESHSHFPMSLVSLGLKMPIFTGGSNSAKVKKAKVELMKSECDEKALSEALTMSYLNSKMQLEQQLLIVEAQVSNKSVAKEVYDVTEANFSEGISSLTDVLNASTSLVQAEVNFSTALNNCIKSYLELRRAEGTLLELIK